MTKINWLLFKDINLIASFEKRAIQQRLDRVGIVIATDKTRAVIGQLVYVESREQVAVIDAFGRYTFNLLNYVPEFVLVQNSNLWQSI